MKFVLSSHIFPFALLQINSNINYNYNFLLLSYKSENNKNRKKIHFNSFGLCVAIRTKIAFPLNCSFGLLLFNFHFWLIQLTPSPPSSPPLISLSRSHSYSLHHCHHLCCSFIANASHDEMKMKKLFNGLVCFFSSSCVTIVGLVYFDSFVRFDMIAYNWITFHVVLISMCLKIIFNRKSDTAAAGTSAPAKAYVQSISFLFRW